MKPLFSVHAGEYLTGSHIERHFPRVNVWLPAKDTGIDLLVTNGSNGRSVSLQVKFSKDWLVTDLGPEFQASLRACGWWTLNRSKVNQSPADYWVFVLQGFDSRSTDFVVLPPSELLRRLDRIHGRQSRIQTYLWITKDRRCWEARDLKRRDQHLLAHGHFTDHARDFSRWLNAWSPIAALNR